MDQRCETIAGLLGRVVEGETTPDESYRVARHLPECTPCRILLAREQRLAAALDGLAGPDREDPGLLDRVMASLGKRPAPKRNRAEKGFARRGLRLAAFLATLPALQLVSHVASGWHLFESPWTAGSPAFETWTEMLAAAAGSAAAAFAAVGELSFSAPLGLSAATLLAGCATSLALAGGGLATALALLLAAGAPRRVP